MILQELIEIFSPYMKIEEVEALGIQLDHIMKNQAAPESLSECGEIIFEVLKRLKREMMIKKLTEFNSALNTKLTEYVHADIASKIEQNATAYLLNALNTGQDYFDIELAFGKRIRDELMSVVNKKKSVDRAEYPFRDVFREYELSIDKELDQVNNKVSLMVTMEIVYSMSSEEQNQFVAQTARINQWQNEARQYVESKWEQIKEQLDLNARILQQKMIDATDRLLSEGRPRGEAHQLASDEIMPLKKAMRQEIDCEIEKLLTEWCVAQPPEISNAIDRDKIKGQLCGFLENFLLAKVFNGIFGTCLSILAPISELEPMELKNTQEQLRIFLTEAFTPKLTCILTETLVEMDADAFLNEAVFDFFLLINVLPESVQELFKSNLSIEDKQKKIQELDLTAWVPSKWILVQLDSSRNLLKLIDTYAELYVTHLSKLDLDESPANKKRQEEDLLQLSIGTVNPGFVWRLEMSINKNNDNMFNLYANKANKATLKEVHRRVTESKDTPSNPALFQRFLKSLENRLSQFPVSHFSHEQNEESEEQVSSFRP